ncbi:hypothetical protein DH2020_037001 [Rehmannia glutinosa]|uniref:UDP-glycosyltransferase n=1 Tax=Rehmannia glutinosa TaxID=99300 RepID=A0ABR0V3A3_REHGL
MSLTNSFVQTEHPRLVFLPSGVGNSTPFFQLAVMLASRNCKVTFINVQPQTPEFARFASFFANHPIIEILDFEFQSHTPSDSTVNDPFIIHIENINRSLYQLIPILSSSQISAIFSDFVLAATLSQISADLNIHFYLISTTSAQFFSVIAHLPFLLAENPNIFSNSSGDIEIQGLAPIPKSNIPPTWMNDSTNYLLTAYLLPNARSLAKVNGVFLNTFNWFEPETIAALNSNRVLNSLPPVFPIGPMQSYHPLESLHLPWLSEQPAESVVYVNFGSREVMSTDQIRELRKGLEICRYNYLWAMKDDNGEFSGYSCLKGTRKGEIIRGGVDQEKVLAHPAIGGYVNQCEWDSVIQAAWCGVPVLAWPQHGDQKMNAEIVEKVGLGIWMKEWGWGGETLVAGKEIGRLVAQIMGDLNIKKKAKIVREKAREACEIGGARKRFLLKCSQAMGSS